MIFQFTPLREGRLHRCRGRCLPRYFNSRPCERGDYARGGNYDKSSKFQFTPLREGRPVEAVDHQREVLFQFTPLREGRQSCKIFLFLPFVFQFTPLREGRRFNVGELVPIFVISIHAPARGATKAPQGASCFRFVFQFTPLREGRLPITMSQVVQQSQFQFTPLREGRHFRHFSIQYRCHFNSRPCERGDGSNLPVYAMDEISIHAPARGATLLAAGRLAQLLIFQFTPLREGRRTAAAGPVRQSCNFNSRPCERGDGCAHS